LSRRRYSTHDPYRSSLAALVAPLLKEWAWDAAFGNEQTHTGSSNPNPSPDALRDGFFVS
jgi:hypothetical protein